MSQILLGLVPMDVTNDMPQSNFNGVNERMEARLTQTIALGAVHDNLLCFDSNLSTWVIAKTFEQYPGKD